MSRVYFKRAQTGCRPVTGMPIRLVQQTLDREQLLQRSVDSVFGDDTEQALYRYQVRVGVPSTGAIDLDTWTHAVDPLPPSLFMRCSQLTIDFEGHGFELVVGNYDGAGLTWGIIGFTLLSGDIRKIVEETDAKDRTITEGAFGPLAAELRAVFARPVREQILWADAMTSGADRKALPPQWVSAFARFGRSIAVQAIQVSLARDKYWGQARQIAPTYGLTTELGYALAFDIAVQNGGVKLEVARAIANQVARAAGDQLALRTILADAVAAARGRKYQAVVSARKLTIARGTGIVNKSRYTLLDWGLEDLAAVPD